MRARFRSTAEALVGLCLLALPAAAEELSARRRQLAAELVQAMGLEAQVSASLSMMADLVVQQNQAAASYREAILEWARKVLTWSAIAPQVTELYGQAFTEQELRDLVAFYGTPTGKKAAAKMPELSQQMMVLGQQLALAHADDLTRLIREQEQRQKQAADPAAAAGAAPSTAPSAAPSAALPEPSEEDRFASKASVAALRNVGTAMMSWLTDAFDNWHPSDEKAPPGTNWSRCPQVSYEELQAVLSPPYLAAVPRTDGWGHPLEFCLDRKLAQRDFLIGLRSPGRDGRFEGVDYVVGKFDPADVDRDIVWLDGFFITWPQR